MRFLPVNTDALLVELDDLAHTLALYDSLRHDPLHGVTELVPAARTLLVQFRSSATTPWEIVAALRSRDLTLSHQRAGDRVEIPVRYEGEDLAEVAQLLGIDRAEVVRRHTGSDYTVAFTGFAPGFAYLSGGHPSLQVPRRRTPRTRIPAGAVGLAGQFSGVYPRASPGGWQIIGVTDLPMWDLSRPVPALLQPGLRVRFVDITGQPAATAHTTPPLAPITAPLQGPALHVQSVGTQVLLQDLGRPGKAHLGVSRSGALDAPALRTANRLVGNRSDCAALEIVYGGLTVCSQGETVVAVTGAEAPLCVTTSSGLQYHPHSHQAIALADGDTLHLGTPARGMRSYLAARGGWALEPVLGSLSTDTLSGLGPAPIAVGDRLPLQSVAGPSLAVTLSEPAPPSTSLPTTNELLVLDVIMGPRSDWFSPDTRALLSEQEWTITPQSNRIGLRLHGATPLERSRQDELPSEGTVPGALQVPPNGQPVLFLADHPLTGGYPVIAAVASHHLALVAQAPIGTRIRFRPIAPWAEITQPDSGTHPTPTDKDNL